jgi:hypothetical protein
MMNTFLLDLCHLFQESFIVKRTDYGWTQMDENISWRSTWFWDIRRRTIQ